MGLLQPKTQGIVCGNWEKPYLKLKWHLVLYQTYTLQPDIPTLYHAKLSKRFREYNPSPPTFSSVQPNEKGKTHMDELFNNI